jgi:anthranilate/para-aminobenzoate synthase component I
VTPVSRVPAPARTRDRRGIVTHRRRSGTPALLVPVPGRVSAENLLAALAHRPWPVLARHGDLTVVASDPVETVTGPDVWDVLAADPLPSVAASMAGGWMGLLSDGFAGTIEHLPSPAPDPAGAPDAALARYRAVALIDDHGRCTLATTGPAGTLRHLERALVEAHRPPESTHNHVGEPRSSFSAEEYRAAVNRIRELIAAGDCYQVNLAQRLSAPWTASPTEFATRLWHAAGAARYRAFLGLPAGAVVSASPECLLRVHDGIAVSEPIKGTAPPGGAAGLAVSKKDRAEHVMIVDLVRNDLGRVAVPGGVSVEALMEPLSTGYVEHLVSQVRAEVAPGATARDVLRAVFPGGSVTGTPKVRAMEVIREIEPVGRGPAFGSVVTVGRDASVDASVTIRTAWIAGGEAHYWCGGAVVWDSDPETERLEAWAKARPFLRAIGAP